MDFDKIVSGALNGGVSDPAGNDQHIDQDTIIEKIDGEIIPPGWGGSMPGWIAEKIAAAVSDFMLYEQNPPIKDIKKESGNIWRALCMYVGRTVFKPGRLLEDDEKRRKAGKGGGFSVGYDIEKILLVLDVWESYCFSFDKVPFKCDFFYFCGIRNEWLFQYEDRAGENVSPAWNILVKRLDDIFELGLVNNLTDGKKNPVGTIFYLKAKRGYNDGSTLTIRQETTPPTLENIANRLGIAENPPDDQ